MLDRILTQVEFAELVGIGQPAVSDLQRRGVLRPNVTGASWLRAYCEQLREQAAGRAGTLAENRAALDNERRIEIAMRNAIKRKEFAPVSALSEVLAKVGRQVAGTLDGIGPAIRLRWPDVTAEQLRLVDAEIAKARNLAAGISLDQLVDEDEAADR